MSTLEYPTAHLDISTQKGILLCSWPEIYICLSKTRRPARPGSEKLKTFLLHLACEHRYFQQRETKGGNPSVFAGYTSLQELTAKPWESAYLKHTLLFVSIILLVFYHKCCSLIGNPTHYLFCCRTWVAAVNKMLATFSQLLSLFQCLCKIFGQSCCYFLNV